MNIAEVNKNKKAELNQPDLTLPSPQQVTRNDIRARMKNALFKDALKKDSEEAKNTLMEIVSPDGIKVKPKRVFVQYKVNEEALAQGLNEKAEGFFTDGSFENKYELHEILGEGTVGTVKRATSKDKKEEFAVKVVRTRDMELLLNLKNEFSNLKRLDHPNIVKVFELHYDPKTAKVYIVQELVKGREMLEMLQELGAYSEKDASHVFTQILNAIEFLHSQGITHRDLKPNNILISPKLDVKIIDFNVAKFAEQYKNYSSFTANNYKMLTYTGTIAYTAPEIFIGGEYSEEVDMWSAGAVLYTMLCGYQPFQAEYVKDLIDEIVEGKADFKAEPWDQISKEAKSLVKKCLQKNPQLRILPVEALSHPWLLNQTATDKNIAEIVKGNIKKNEKSLIRSIALKEKLTHGTHKLKSSKSLTSLLKHRGDDKVFDQEDTPRKAVVEFNTVGCIKDLKEEDEAMKGTHSQDLKEYIQHLHNETPSNTPHDFRSMVSKELEEKKTDTKDTEPKK